MELPIGNVYQQSPRDERSTQWGAYNFRGTVNDTSSSISVGGGPAEDVPWNPPAGYVAHIKGFNLFANPGAGQNINSAFVEIRDSANNLLIIAWRHQEALAADANFTTTPQLDLILISPIHVLKATVIFNSGVASNQVQFSTQAILIPKGNVALF
jgi:hypothetical protein